MSEHLIEKANQAYYEDGEPILTDQEFDLLSDNGLSQDGRNFRKKVDHVIPMGSLSKLKTQADVEKWVADRELFVAMPKLDGNSIALSYRDGKLVRAATRGNGASGNDITGHVQMTNVPKQIPLKGDIEVRAEAIMKKAHQESFEKNIRNVVAGVLGAKDKREELLSLIDVVAFDIVGEGIESWDEKMAALKKLPAQNVVPFYVNAPGKASRLPWMGEEIYRFAEGLYKGYREVGDYQIDGVVVLKLEAFDTPIPEQGELIPKNKVAVKFGTEGAVGTVGEIEWNLGKHGRLTPVLVLEAPVVLDGTNVQRISASNYSLLKEAGLGPGAVVEVVKSGDIIPFVKNVITPCFDGLELPACPACQEQSTLSDSGVNALCEHPECTGAGLVTLQRIFPLFGLEFISDATLKSFYDAGHTSLEAIFSLSAEQIAALDGFGEKSAAYIVDSLGKIEMAEELVIKAAGLPGIGERKGRMLLDHYGSIAALVQSVRESAMADIPNFGPVQTRMISERIEEIAEMASRLAALGVQIIAHEKNEAASIKVCCTGTCPGYTRDELKALLAERGCEMIKDVSKDCQLLLCADPTAESSKLKKARKNGVEIMGYAQFLEGQNPLAGKEGADPVEQEPAEENRLQDEPSQETGQNESPAQQPQEDDSEKAEEAPEEVHEIGQNEQFYLF